MSVYIKTKEIGVLTNTVELAVQRVCKDIELAYTIFADEIKLECDEEDLPIIKSMLCREYNDMIRVLPRKRKKRGKRIR